MVEKGVSAWLNTVATTWGKADTVCAPSANIKLRIVRAYGAKMSAVPRVARKCSAKALNITGFI